MQMQGENISKVPLFPPFVEGIIIHNKHVLPLIRLSECLGLQERNVPESALILEEAGQCFGLLVDSVGENLDGRSVQIAPLPPLASSAWMHEAVLSRQEILPLINPFILLAGHNQAREQMPAEQYTLDSRFSSLQYKQEIEVVEFTLLGIKHAIPGCETENIVPFRPFWQVPTSNSLLMGVSEYEGMILPVLDLAPLFGKKSAPAPDWSMLLVANGEFQALVVAETVLGKRLLGVDLQKELPVNMPEDLIYGCYLDEDSIVLILNTASMAFHTEDLNMQELQDMLPSVAAAGEAAQATPFGPSQETGDPGLQEIGVEDQIPSEKCEKV